MNQIEGIISVTVGNIVAIRLGMSRQTAFSEFVVPSQIEGFRPDLHKVVVPLTPFKPGTTEHWDDKGLHITVAQHGRDIGGGAKDVVGESAMNFHDKVVTICFDPSSVNLLEGTPANDEAVGCVYYIGLGLDADSTAMVNDLRAKLQLPPLDALPHVSVGGIGPINDDVAEFRETYCPPRPTQGFPLPLKGLTIQKK